MNLLGSFGKNQLISRSPFAESSAPTGRQDIVLSKFGTVDNTEKTGKVFFGFVFKQIALISAKSRPDLEGV